MRQSKACEAIITNSQYTKKDLLKYYPNLDNQKIYPIHLASQQCKTALDPAIVDKYLPNDWRDRGYIIYLGGALTQNKNSLGVLEAYYKFTQIVSEGQQGRQLNESGSGHENASVINSELVNKGEDGSVNESGNDADNGSNTSNKADNRIKNKPRNDVVYELNTNNKTDNRTEDEPGKSNEPESFPYLAIAGTAFTKEDDPRLNQLHEYITQKGLDGDVIFTGYYEDEDKFQLLKGAITFIHLSTYEGFGLPVLEALTAGVPVIAHNGTTYPEIIADAGILVDGTDSSATAEQIYRLHKDAELRQKYAQKAKARAAKFSWEKTAQETLKVLRSIDM
ncbi:glycosyltransferase [Candidatus Dojkabacteria bacterium]|nr:glycosyltransferase [Candidatus Dojkabacteria bacterium]